MATSLYEHSLNRTQDTVAALRSRRRASAAAAGVTVQMPRIPPAGTAQGEQPTELLHPTDPTTTGLGSSDAPTAAVGSGGGPTRRIGAGGTTSPELTPRRPWGRWIGATAIVFVLGLTVVTGLELLKGSTLINGEAGTSVGRVLERPPAEESPIPTLEPTATTKPSYAPRAPPRPPNRPRRRAHLATSGPTAPPAPRSPPRPPRPIAESVVWVDPARSGLRANSYTNDGTLVLGTRDGGDFAPLPGAVELTALLADRGVPYAVFTNGSAKSPAITSARSGRSA